MYFLVRSPPLTFHFLSPRFSYWSQRSITSLLLSQYHRNYFGLLPSFLPLNHFRGRNLSLYFCSLFGRFQGLIWQSLEQQTSHRCSCSLCSERNGIRWSPEKLDHTWKHLKLAQPTRGNQRAITLLRTPPRNWACSPFRSWQDSLLYREEVASH